MLSGLIRHVVVPFLKRNSGALAGNVLKTGVQVVDDLVRGKTFKETVKRRMPEAIKPLHQLADWFGKPKRKRRRHRHRDIFD